MLALLAAGCSVFSATPAAHDPNAGGGKGAPVEEAGGGIALPGSEEAAPTAPAPIEGVALPPLAAGGSIEHSAVTFQLNQVETAASSTVLRWQVSGLPENYAPGKNAGGEFSLQLGDGSLLKAIGAEGGANTSSGESGVVTFPALPGGTKSFILVIPNSWSGNTETWLIPVTLP